MQKARWLCDLRDKVVPRHRDMPHSSTEEHCNNMTTNQLMTWNNMSSPMMLSSAAHARRTNTQGTHSVRRWMMTLRTTPEESAMDDETGGDADASESLQVDVTPTAALVQTKTQIGELRLQSA